MTERPARRLAWSLWALAIVASAASVLFLVLSRDVLLPQETFGFRGFAAIWAIVFATFGALVAARRPGNAIGWLFLGVGVASGVLGLAEEYAIYALLGRGGAFPGGLYAAWVTGWIWVPLIGAATTMVFLLFPDGRLPSPRWRAVAVAAIGSMALGSLGFATLPGEVESNVPVENPFGVPASRALVEGLAFGSLMLLTATAIASVVALVRRFRRSAGDEHQQIKWVVFAASVLGAALLVGMTTYGLSAFAPVDPTFLEALSNLLVITFLALPVAGGVAVLRYGLYEIDMVINRAVVFALLAAFITGVYLAIVVGIGAALGGRDNVLLSVAATAAVAVAFQPARERARHFANRLVYGQRATPYEVLSEFADRVGGSYALDDILPRMARTVGEGTGAARATVWLKVSGDLRPSAVWPNEDVGPGEGIAAAGDKLPPLPDADRALPVMHGGELLGALAVEKPKGEALSGGEEKLLSDLAAQAGLVLRNVRLTEELKANLEELRASRQRIVSAQDEERRRIERNIHDGAQQQLIAMSVKLRLAQTLTQRDPAKAEEMLAQLQREMGDAHENLRDLARGIYPPLLSDRGLVAALDAQARKAPIAVSVSADRTGRYLREVEAAIYFCVLEALQNAAKYGARSAHVELSSDDGVLSFAVIDDGPGFDPTATPRGAGLENMRDRLEALGGSFEIRSDPGAGTTLLGRVPAQPVAAAQASSSRSGSNSDLGM